jgi:hypothetical protein
MPATIRPPNLWTVIERQWIDPADFAAAIERQIRERDLDFRSKLLIRDGTAALREVWGDRRWQEWLGNSSVRTEIESICGEQLGRAGFPTLARHLVETTKPDTIERFLRELGSRVPATSRIAVGGSAALILRQQLARQTDDIDVVDEIPAPIRVEHALLQDLLYRFRLQLTHFQSHYLPSGWDARLTSYGRFGALDVALVDTYDIAASKLMSPRTKDRDDLRALVAHLDKETFAARVQANCESLLNEPDVRKNAELNWYVLYGEPLPA